MGALPKSTRSGTHSHRGPPGVGFAQAMALGVFPESAGSPVPPGPADLGGTGVCRGPLHARAALRRRGARPARHELRDAVASHWRALELCGPVATRTQQVHLAVPAPPRPRPRAALPGAIATRPRRVAWEPFTGERRKPSARRPPRWATSCGPCERGQLPRGSGRRWRDRWASWLGGAAWPDGPPGGSPVPTGSSPGPHSRPGEQDWVRLLGGLAMRSLLDGGHSRPPLFPERPLPRSSGAQPCFPKGKRTVVR
jgi:hypothetical protein